MHAPDLADHKSAIEDRLLDKLASCDWRIAAERQRTYTQFADALKHMQARARSSGRSVPLQGYDAAVHNAVLAIERAVKGAASLDDIRQALKPRSAAAPDQPTGSRRDETPFAPADLRSEARPLKLLRAVTPAAGWLRRLQDWALVGLALGVLVLAGTQLWQLLAPAGSCTASSSTCFDSGWQPVSSKANTTYFFRHALGQVPRNMTLWFSPMANGARAFLVTWKFPRPESGNPVTIEAQSDVIYVHVWNGMPIHGVFDARSQNWTTFNEGFYRVVATK